MMNVFKCVLFAAAAAAGSAVHGAWVVDTTAKTLTDTEAGWGFTITIANDSEITLTGKLSGFANAGDLRLDGMPDDYAVVCIKDKNVLAGNTQLTSFSEPNKLTTLGSESFSYCSGLTNVVGLSNVTTMGGVATSGGGQFNECTNLKGCLALPKITLVPYYAFRNTKIESLEIPNVTVWGRQAFPTTITNVVFDAEKLTFIGSAPVNALVGDLFLPNVTSVEGMGNNSTITSVHLPKVQELKRDAFACASSLTNFTGGLELTSVADGAFYETKLKGCITWPQLTTLGSQIFWNGPAVQDFDLSALTTFSGSRRWLPSASITNIVFGPVTAMPKGVMSGARNCHVVFLGDVPEFNVASSESATSFANPNTELNFFEIRNKDCLENWKRACFVLKTKEGPYAEYFYKNGVWICPKKTIGLIDTVTGDGFGTIGWAYVIDSVPPRPGLVIMLW